MAYTYRVMHLDKTQHNLNYKYGSKFTPTQITYHQTANNAPAINERNYLNNRTDNVYIGFHLVVDDKEAIECLPLTVQTWHAGDGSTGPGNMKSIGVEMAYSTSSNLDLRNAAIENGAKLIATLMKDYNIPLSNVVPHQARSGKYCPHDILERYGHEKFRALIQTEYEKLTIPAPTPTPTPNPVVEFQVGDTVLVSKTIQGYTTANSTTASTTVSPGKYKVYKVVTNTFHPVNVSKIGQEPGAWVDKVGLSLIENASFQPGDQVQVIKRVPGYNTSINTNSTTFVEPGTYYVYKYVAGAPHAVNVSKSSEIPGAWINVSDLRLV